MRQRRLPQKDFISATEGVVIPILRHSVRELPPARPLYEILSREEYSALQLERQRKQLAENEKNKAAADTDQNTAQQHQPVVRYSNAHREQAAMQENSGSIFSSAFFHIHFR
jgi:hypothetical protein